MSSLPLRSTDPVEPADDAPAVPAAANPPAEVVEDATPSLAEQRASRRHRRGLASDLRSVRGAA